MERLSWLSINSASDDAAGLAISTRMESQIKGLTMAVKNAHDGISALAQQKGPWRKLLRAQRIRELAIQSSNDKIARKIGISTRRGRPTD